MDFFEVVKRRYSYRGEFTADHVPNEDIIKILDCGIRAPSGKNRQTTSFVVVTDEALKQKIIEIFPHRGIETAPVLIIALTSYMEVHNGTAFELEDYSAAVENILLAVTALGYASVWLDGYTKDEGRREKIADILNVPEGKTVRAVLPIGRAKNPGEQYRKRPFEDRVHYNAF
jgi:nitroreductase